MTVCSMHMYVYNNKLNDGGSKTLKEIWQTLKEFSFLWPRMLITFYAVIRVRQLLAYKCCCYCICIA